VTTCIILTRFSTEAFEDPKRFKNLADAVTAKIKKQCLDVTWKGSFATLGVAHFLEADDPKQIEKAAMIIRAYGHFNDRNDGWDPWEEFLSTL